MTKPMPQEIEVWYLLPALRKELARVFVDDHNLTQKEAAKMLGITESAISQYRKSKRGGELKFTAKDNSIIKIYAEKMLKDKEHVTKYLYNLCVEFRGSKTLCELHKKHDAELPEQCKICIEER